MLAGKAMANLMQNERMKQGLANMQWQSTQQMVKAVIKVFETAEREGHIMGMDAKLNHNWQTIMLDWDAQMATEVGFLREQDHRDTVVSITSDSCLCFTPRAYGVMNDADKYFKEFVEPWAFAGMSAVNTCVVPGGGFKDLRNAHDAWTNDGTTVLRGYEMFVSCGSDLCNLRNGGAAQVDLTQEIAEDINKIGQCLETHERSVFIGMGSGRDWHVENF